MPASQQYKDTLAHWLLAESDRWGSAEKFAARLRHPQIPEKGVSGQYLRNLARGKFRKDLDDDLVVMFADYRKESLAQTKAWLNGGALEPKKGDRAIAQSDIEAINDIHKLLEIQRWALDRQQQLIAQMEQNTYCQVNSASDLREHLQQHLTLISNRSEIPKDRLSAIASGANPELGEIAMLAKYFSPIGHTDQLLKLFPEVTEKRQHRKKIGTRQT
jgi:hypothetical protein